MPKMILMWKWWILFLRLSGSKQSKVYLPEPPFPHAEVIIINPFSGYVYKSDMLTRGYENLNVRLYLLIFSWFLLEDLGSTQIYMVCPFHWLYRILSWQPSLSKKTYVNCHKYTICQIGTWTHIFVNILNWIILWYMYSFITVWNHNWKNLDAIRAWLFLDCCRNYILLSCMYLKEEWRKMAKIMNEMDSYWKVML